MTQLPVHVMEVRGDNGELIGRSIQGSGLPHVLVSAEVHLGDDLDAQSPHSEVFIREPANDKQRLVVPGHPVFPISATELALRSLNLITPQDKLTQDNAEDNKAS